MAVQIPLGLKEYPRPIAWTLSEVERATGYRDRAGMLFTAFEEVSRFLVWTLLARYGEYWREGARDDAVEQHVAALRRPSFGHYVQALLALDNCLEAHDDAFRIGMKRPENAPAAQALLQKTSRSTPKKVTRQMLLAKVVHLRNKEKGHGYSSEDKARELAEMLELALREFLDATPVLLERPLVWIERIEFIDADRSLVTYLKLMGTRRASRHETEVRSPGALRRGSLFMWDHDAAPLQLSPFLHLEHGQHDEKVFVLAGFAGEPSYQARGGSVSTKRPDRLIEQFEQRAPFLLEEEGGVTTVRRPEGDRLYKSAVELALADGRITAAEASKLDSIRHDLGLSEGEANAVHRDLGWNPDESGLSPTQTASTAGELPLRQFLSSVRRSLGTLESELDAEIEVNRGELWFPVGEAQGVSVWLPRKRAGDVQVAVGFYSRHRRRDPAYRDARERIADSGAVPPKGWRMWTEKSRCEQLAWETRRMVPLPALSGTTLRDEVSALVLALCNAARAAMEPAAAAVEDTAAAAHGAFDLRPLEGSPRERGSVWLPRILWALEWGARHESGPMSAADIARVLCANGVQVPPTNTARAFRTKRDDPRQHGLCDEPHPQRYKINEAGRRALAQVLCALLGQA